MQRVERTARIMDYHHKRRRMRKRLRKRSTAVNQCMLTFAEAVRLAEERYWKKHNLNGE